MTDERTLRLPVAAVPGLDRAVLSSGCQVDAVRGVGDRVHRTGLAGKPVLLFSRAGVPDPYGAVVLPAGQSGTVRRVGHRQYAAAVGDEAMLPASDVPDPEAVPARAGEGVAVWSVCDRRDTASVASELGFLAAGAGVPDPDGAILFAAAGQLAAVRGVGHRPHVAGVAGQLSLL